MTLRAIVLLRDRNPKKRRFTIKPRITVTGVTRKMGSVVTEFRNTVFQRKERIGGRLFVRKAAARKDRSCHLQFCSESV